MCVTKSVSSRESQSLKISVIPITQHLPTHFETLCRQLKGAGTLLPLSLLYPIPTLMCNCSGLPHELSRTKKQPAVGASTPAIPNA